MYIRTELSPPIVHYASKFLIAPEMLLQLDDGYVHQTAYKQLQHSSVFDILSLDEAKKPFITFKTVLMQTHDVSVY